MVSNSTSVNIQKLKFDLQAAERWDEESTVVICGLPLSVQDDPISSFWEPFRTAENLQLDHWEALYYAKTVYCNCMKPSTCHGLQLLKECEQHVKAYSHRPKTSSDPTELFKYSSLENWSDEIYGEGKLLETLEGQYDFTECVEQCKTCYTNMGSIMERQERSGDEGGAVYMLCKEFHITRIR